MSNGAMNMLDAVFLYGFPPDSQEVMLARLRAERWIIASPGHIPMPRNRVEAEGMNLVSESWLRNHPKEPT